MSRRPSPTETEMSMAIPQHEIRTGPGLSQESERDAESGPNSILSVDEIMLRINREVISRGGLLPSAVPMAATATMSRLARWQPSVPRIPVKQEYVLGELLSFSDIDFVENAYRAVLRRTPDEGGLAHHLSRLRNGQASKVEILAALRWSAEGEKAGVHVDGLLAPFLLQKWRRKRFIGPMIGWVQSLARLSSLSDRQILLDAAHAREAHELGRILNLQAQQFEKLLSEIDAAHTQRASTATAALEALSMRLDGELGRLDAHAHALAERIDQLSGKLAEQVAVIPTLQAGVDGVRAHSHAVADQVGTLSARMDELAGVDAHSHAVADQVGMLSHQLAGVHAHSHAVAGQVGTLSARLDELAGVDAHSHEVADQVGTLSTRLDALADVREHSFEVADQVGTLSTRLDGFADLHDQAQALVHRVDTVSARLDAQPDVVPVVRLISERIEEMSSQLQASRLSPPARRKDQSGNRRGK